MALHCIHCGTEIPEEEAMDVLCPNCEQVPLEFNPDELRTFKPGDFKKFCTGKLRIKET